MVSYTVDPMSVISTTLGLKDSEQSLFMSLCLWKLNYTECSCAMKSFK